MSKLKRFIDIGANLTDPMYSGIYNGKQKHEGDIQNVLNRTWDSGIEKVIITGGSLTESKKALELARSDEKLYSTVGCHPTRCLEFETNNEHCDYLNELEKVALGNKDKIVAIGECGLDYDRVQFCPIDIQKSIRNINLKANIDLETFRYFEVQLQLSQKLNLPVFLHCRNAAQDLYEILSKYSGLKGVVHSFDGSSSEAKQFIDLGYFIGLNGCSIKTPENLETVKDLPMNRILLETDCPWCEIRPTHAGFKYISKANQTFPSVKKEKWNATCLIKSRNEPVNIRQVFDVIAGIRQENPDELCERIYRNALELFFERK